MFEGNFKETQSLPKKKKKSGNIVKYEYAKGDTIVTAQVVRVTTVRTVHRGG